MTTHGDSGPVTIRRLRPDDLEAVVALDARLAGAQRRGYFERRLRAALRQPERHVQLAADGARGLSGFVLARAAGGEYGRPEEVLALEAIGVDPALRGRRVGQQLVADLAAAGGARGARGVVTQVDWRNHAMLRLLDRAGFALAPEQVLVRPVHRMPLPATDEEIETPPPLVRNLRDADLAAIARIDERITGRDREPYLRRKVDEALHESAIAVSLVAEDDGFVVAFATAHVDYGDFGHVEATASLDTIGIDPGFVGRGFARAILTQLIDNLAALHVEQIETEVARDDFALSRFLYRFGFRPASRLPFHRPAKV